MAQSRRRDGLPRVPIWLTPLLALLPTFPLAADLTLGNDVYILRVAPLAASGENNETVRVQLAWKETSSIQSAVLEWRDPTGFVVGSKKVLGPMSFNGTPSFEVDLAGVLAKVPTYGWSYWVAVRSDGTSSVDLTDPFPVHVTGCSESWQLVPGLATDVVVVSKALSSALDSHTDSLEKLAELRPDLACEISTVSAQLELLGDLNPPGAPLCFWQVQVLGRALDTVLQGFDLSGAHYQGIESGATHCYSSRAEGLSGPIAKRASASTPCDGQGLPSARTRLKIKTRCRKADGTFGGVSCDGTLAYDAEIEALAKARLNADSDGISRVCGSEIVDLKLGGQLLGRVRALALHTGEDVVAGGEEDQPSGSFESSSGQPATVELQTTGGADSTNLPGVQSFAEYGNWFSIDATATSACTVFAESLVHFEGAPFLPVRQGYHTVIPQVRNQSGNIKEPDW